MNGQYDTVQYGRQTLCVAYDSVVGKVEWTTDGEPVLDSYEPYVTTVVESLTSKYRDRLATECISDKFTVDEQHADDYWKGTQYVTDTQKYQRNPNRSDVGTCNVYTTWVNDNYRVVRHYLDDERNLTVAVKYSPSEYVFTVEFYCNRKVGGKWGGRRIHVAHVPTFRLDQLTVAEQRITELTMRFIAKYTA